MNRNFLLLCLLLILTLPALAQTQNPTAPDWLVNPNVDKQKIISDLFEKRRDAIDRAEASSLEFQRPVYAQSWEERARQHWRATYASLEGVNLKDEQAVYDRIVETSTFQESLICQNTSAFSGKQNLTAADCGFTGSVNSGSGIGVAVGLTFANRPIRGIQICRAGICFDYDHVVTTFSEISGACFSATYSVTVTWADGSTCTAATMGSPPHSACTEVALANSVAFVSAASYSEQVAPGTIGAGFNVMFTDQTAYAPSVPLPFELAGLRAYVFKNTPREKQIPFFYVAPGQVIVLLPDDLASGGLATVQFLNVAQDTLRPGFFSSNPIEPGVFTVDQNGHGTAAGYVDRKYDVNFATGLAGATDGYVQQGQQQVNASYVGLQGQFVGLYQINFLAPNFVSGGLTQFCARKGSVTRCSQFFLKR